MASNSPSIIILAAGKGTRMKSERSKVLHEIGRRSLLGHVLALCGKLDPREIIVVTSTQNADIAKTAKSIVPSVKIAVQKEQLGTGDAVRSALPSLGTNSGDVLVLYADTPFVSDESIKTMLAARTSGAGIVVMGFRPLNPARYGRLVTRGNNEVERIIEYADASPAEREIAFCNSGIFLIDAGEADKLIAEIKNNNAKHEFYLTDIVEIGRRRGVKTIAVEADASEVLGINSRSELASAETLFQHKARERAMEEGATLIDPRTVYFSADTKLGKDVTIGPNVVFGPGVSVDDNVVIDAFCHIEGAHISSGARIGPFARLRPGAEIGINAHIGNFVEIKKALIEEGAKVNHLTYIGDARVGAATNVGAGTITCNYDGFDKHFTDIGANAFIGSNTSLIAPVKVGDGSYIGSGSVIAKDVEPNALALSRAELIEKPEWAAKFRARKKHAKPAKE